MHCNFLSSYKKWLAALINPRRRVRCLTHGKRKNPSDLRRHEKSHIIPFQAKRRARDAAEAFMDQNEKAALSHTEMIICPLLM